MISGFGLQLLCTAYKVPEITQRVPSQNKDKLQTVQKILKE